MTDLAPHTNDIVHRYVVGEQTLRQIGVHYGVNKESVRQRLIAAGVQIRSADGDMSALRPAPLGRETEADPDVWERRDRRHVSSIVRALQNKGLPFYPATELRI